MHHFISESAYEGQTGHQTFSAKRSKKPNGILTDIKLDCREIRQKEKRTRETKLPFGQNPSFPNPSICA